MDDVQMAKAGPWVSSIVAQVGDPWRGERMMGVGGPGCWKVIGPHGQAVLKTGVSAPERVFYEHIAPRVPVKTPYLYAAGEDPNDWVLTEFLQGILDPSRWGPDKETLAYLARLHSHSTQLLDQSIAGYVFEHPGTWGEDIAPMVSPMVYDRLMTIVEGANESFCELLAPHALVHGDPNPTNWLMSRDGELVLTDWSRYGWAHPALDIAILLPGMPSRAGIRTSASRYHVFTGSARESIEHLEELVALGKLWSFLEFLTMASRDRLSSAASDGLAMVTDSLNTWLGQVFNAWFTRT